MAARSRGEKVTKVTAGNGCSGDVSEAEIAAVLRQKMNIVKPGQLRPLDMFAYWITKWVGSISFFLIIFCWTLSWLGWNTLMPRAMRFDPFPAFVLWLFISNVIQILLMPLLLVGQNLQGVTSEKRAKADFEINVKAELQNEKILEQLQKNYARMDEILDRLNQKEGDRNKE